MDLLITILGATVQSNSQARLTKSGVLAFIIFHTPCSLPFILLTRPRNSPLRSLILCPLDLFHQILIYFILLLYSYFIYSLVLIPILFYYGPFTPYLVSYNVLQCPSFGCTGQNTSCSQVASSSHCFHSHLTAHLPSSHHSF